MDTTVACHIGKHKLCDGSYYPEGDRSKAGKCECPCHQVTATTTPTPQED